MDVEKAPPFLVYVYVFPLSCWLFDLLTTYYAIDYLGVAGETNPLGWPLGAFGFLVFCVPAFIFTWVLLFRIRNKYSFWVAVLITAMTLGVGTMSLLAALHNIGVAEIYTSSNVVFNQLAGFFKTLLGQAMISIIVSIAVALGLREIVVRIARRLWTALLMDEAKSYDPKETKQFL